MESNYNKQVYIARELFLKYDQEAIIRKFRLKADEKWVYLPMLDRMYRVSRDSGVIEYRSSDQENQTCCAYTECLDYQVVMTIYDVLCCSKDMPVLAHEWCPVYSLQITMSSPNSDTFTGRYAKLFSGNTDRLLAACKKLGGEQPAMRASADVCWQFSVFPFFPVQLRFWDGDEEFAPKIQLLWDKKALDFMHFETIYYVQGHLMERLAELF